MMMPIGHWRKKPGDLLKMIPSLSILSNLRRASCLPWIATVALLTGCAGSISGLPVNTWVNTVVDSRALKEEAPVQITYLGTGGYFIQYGEQAILTAPFFSNPSLFKVLFGAVNADTDRIETALKPLKDDLAGVSAIFVGHSHYDHLMDVPFVFEAFTPKATIYGSKTMAHILAPALPGEMLKTVNDHAASFDSTFAWVPVQDRPIRFLPITSNHAPHFMGIKVFGGLYKKDLSALPTRASGWKEGQTHAYLIDILKEDGAIAFRIYYQDTVSSPPLGLPPRALLRQGERRVDLAILCVPGFDRVENNPEGILKELNPRHVILGHWENFFEPQPQDMIDLTVLPSTDIEEFIHRMQAVLPEDARYILPQPGARLTLPAGQ